MKGKAERAFLEYRRSGRPMAMAAVFDVAAPELLLVAGHLARQTAEAEDLVQTTLLEAMEHCERYDADRPLLPWLLGILVRQHRRELRWRARAIPPDGRAAPDPPDPAEEAENAELVQTLSEAIAGLPSAYRDALSLSVVHGLEPAQIGHALGRPLEDRSNPVATRSRAPARRVAKEFRRCDRVQARWAGCRARGGDRTCPKPGGRTHPRRSWHRSCRPHEESVHPRYHSRRRHSMVGLAYRPSGGGLTEIRAGGAWDHGDVHTRRGRARRARDG